MTCAKNAMNVNDISYRAVVVEEEWCAFTFLTNHTHYFPVKNALATDWMPIRDLDYFLIDI